MLFSVIIPTYNRLAHLRPALDSVFAQSFADYEVIVVDDGSTDGTWAFLETLGRRVTAVRQENAGPGAARNRGVEAARGDYLAFLDSDDLWFPWTLATYREAIRAHGEPAFLAGALHAFGDEGELAKVRETNIQARAYKDFLAAAYDDVWIGAVAVAIKRDIVIATGGFPSEHINGEDSDLWLRAGEAAGFVRIDGPPMTAYRRHEGTAIADLGKTIRGMEHLIRREKQGAYPGGPRRARARREILTRHIRPPVFACLRAGEYQAAWRLYRSAFSWHLSQRRWKFLIGYFLFQLRSILSAVSPGEARK